MDFIWLSLALQGFIQLYPDISVYVGLSQVISFYLWLSPAISGYIVCRVFTAFLLGRPATAWRDNLTILTSLIGTLGQGEAYTVELKI